MENKIVNETKHLVLGITGSEVKCMLLDSLEQIKKTNPHLTEVEVEQAFEILQREIKRKQEELEKMSEPAEEN